MLVIFSDRKGGDNYPSCQKRTTFLIGNVDKFSKTINCKCSYLKNISIQIMCKKYTKYLEV